MSIEKKSTYFFPPKFSIDKVLFEVLGLSKTKQNT